MTNAINKQLIYRVTLKQQQQPQRRPLTVSSGLRSCVRASTMETGTCAVTSTSCAPSKAACSCPCSSCLGMRRGHRAAIEDCTHHTRN